MSDSRLFILCFGEENVNLQKRLSDRLLEANDKLKIEGFLLENEEIVKDSKGPIEKLRQFFKKRSQIGSILTKIREVNPDAILVIEPRISYIPLLKKIKKEGIKILSLLGPDRLSFKKSADFFHLISDELLLTFPVDEDYLSKNYSKAQYVGSPVYEDWSEKLIDDEAMKLQKIRMANSEDDLVLGLMPGASIYDLEVHLGFQLSVYKRLKKDMPKLRLNLLLEEHLDREVVQMRMPDHLEDLSIVSGSSFKMLQSVDFVMATSFRTSLEATLMQKPCLMVFNKTCYWPLLHSSNQSFKNPINSLLKDELIKEKELAHVKVNEIRSILKDVGTQKKESDTTNKYKTLAETLSGSKPYENIINVIYKYV